MKKQNSWHKDLLIVFLGITLFCIGIQYGAANDIALFWSIVQMVASETVLGAIEFILSCAGYSTEIANCAAQALLVIELLCALFAPPQSQ